jgi:very-short-patch-repair endonuclease
MPPIHNRPELKTRRKELRKNATPAEIILWNALKKHQLEGRKFRRQHSIENFIVDFYCAEEKLIIEQDGEVHNNPVAQLNDHFRDSRLIELGFIVLRFENRMVTRQLENVLDAIRNNFKPPLTPP